MTGQFTKCDQCQAEIQTEAYLIGSDLPIGWLWLSRRHESDNDKLPVGHFHFCSERCLTGWIAAKRKTK